MTAWIKTGALALFLLAGAALAGEHWVGVWQVKDTAGQPFKITLAADGSAKADLHGDMVGSWSADGDSAVIEWKTGWTTIIRKSGDGYEKTGYREGAPLDGPPSNSSDAVKEK